MLVIGLTSFLFMWIYLQKALGLLPSSHLEPSVLLEPNLLGKAGQKQHECRPKKYLFYLKVPKTGSSTMTMLIYLWGLRHNLTMVPITYTPWERKGGIIKSCLESQCGSLHSGIYNYFADHTIYNETEAGILLHPDSVYIATMRFPLSQIRSQFVESQIRTNQEDPLQSFMEDMSVPNHLEAVREANMKNRMSLIFGLPVSNNTAPYIHAGVEEDRLAEEALLQKLDSRFDLVLITEYMDESLVLFRRQMCWTMQDIMYIPQRVLHYSHKSKILPWDLQDKHRQWSRSDYKLYEHFIKKLFHEIDQEGSLFWHEVVIFKNMQDQLHDFCNPIYKKMIKNIAIIHELAKEEASLLLDPGPFGKPFNVTGFECAVMKLQTHVIRAMILRRQNPWLCHNRTLHTDIQMWTRAMCFDIHPRWGLSISQMADMRSYLLLGGVGYV